MISKEVKRIVSNRSVSASLVKNYHYIKENLVNIHLFSSYVEPSEFENLTITNLRTHKTDFDILAFESCLIIGSSFKNGDVKAILIEDTKLLGTEFKFMELNDGIINDGVVFRGCKFDGVKFKDIAFANTSFKHCKFINCDFIKCNFTGIDSSARPDLTTQNSFTNCEMKNVLFDWCSFPCRRSTYKVLQIKNGLPSKSLVFTDSYGYIKILNTLKESGLDTSGFKGTCNIKNDAVEITNYGKAIGVDIDNEYSNYANHWDNLCGLDKENKKFSEPKKTTIKKDYPIRYMSEGLL